MKKLQLLLLSFFSGLLCLWMIEGTLRLKGYRPYHPRQTTVIRYPDIPVFIPDPELGYIPNPGTFHDVIADGKLRLQATHLPDGSRMTHPPLKKSLLPKEEIWMYGCSFLYGEWLRDDETLPWQLQERLPQFEIKNYGVDGYGTVNAYLQFQKHLKTKRPPKYVILNYGSFHDERNTFLRNYRKVLVGWDRLGPFTLPYIRLKEADRLVFFPPGESAFEFPFTRQLALSHFLEGVHDSLEAAYIDSQKATWALLKLFLTEAKRNAVKVLVGGITSDTDTLATLAFLKKEGAFAFELGVDITLPINTTLDNGHPSGKANQEYATVYEKQLRQLESMPQDQLFH